MMRERLSTFSHQMVQSFRPVIRSDGRNVIISLSDILYISADDKYSYVHTSEAKYLVRETLSEGEKKLPSPEFCRCSRFNVINMKFYMMARHVWSSAKRPITQ